jgi:hypothetical protein
MLKLFINLLFIKLISYISVPFFVLEKNSNFYINIINIIIYINRNKY